MFLDLLHSSVSPAQMCSGQSLLFSAIVDGVDLWHTPPGPHMRNNVPGRKRVCWLLLVFRFSSSCGRRRILDCREELMLPGFGESSKKLQRSFEAAHALWTFRLADVEHFLLLNCCVVSMIMTGTKTCGDCAPICCDTNCDSS